MIKLKKYLQTKMLNESTQFKKMKGFKVLFPFLFIEINIFSIFLILNKLLFDYKYNINNNPSFEVILSFLFFFILLSFSDKREDNRNRRKKCLTGSYYNFNNYSQIIKLLILEILFITIVPYNEKNLMKCNLSKITLKIKGQGYKSILCLNIDIFSCANYPTMLL